MSLFLFFALLALISLSAFLSASETSLFSLSPLSLKSYKRSSDPRLISIAQLMERPRDLLVTLLMLNIFANILVQNTVSSLFGSYVGWGAKVGIPLALTLIFGEVLPKSFALPYNAKVATFVAPWIEKGEKFLKPIREPLTRATSGISRLLFFFLKEEKEISSEELRHVLRASEESKVLLPQECKLIGGVLDLEQVTAKERMRPREEILFYNIEEPLAELDRLLIEEETTRLPVCEGSLENVAGILTLSQYMIHRKVENGRDLLPLLEKPLFVPETMKGAPLLSMLRERGEPLALVVDEYGSITGLITQEDLIEAVVGEIFDRRDEKELYTRSGDDAIIASGKLELSTLKGLFGVSLTSQEGAVTLGGWLTEKVGDIPTTGTKWTEGDLLFYVLSAEPNRVRTVYVRRLFKKNKGEL